MKTLESLSQNLTWDLTSSPVITNFNGEKLIHEDFKTISRNDNGMLLSVKKQGYTELTNEKFMDFSRRLSDVSGFELKGYDEMQNGKTVFAYLENPNKTKIGDYPIQDFLVLGDNRGGERAFFMGTSTVLIRCQNQFTKVWNSSFERIRHTKLSDLRREELLNYISQYFQNQKQVYENFNKMRKVHIDEGIRQEMIMRVLNLEKEEMLASDKSARLTQKLELINNAIQKEINDLGENAFALFNGITRFTTHDLKARNLTTESFGAVVGSAANINERAYNFAFDLIEV